MLTGPVLVATDLQDGGDAALRQGDALARHLGAILHVCHVLPEVLRVRMLFPQLQQQDALDVEALERRVSNAVADRVQAITGRGQDEYHVSTETASPHSGILMRAEKVKPGVLVMGAGPVAARVVRHAPAPVLVVRSSPSGGVLGATDLSDPSFPAVEAAVAEASRRGVALSLIHCLDLTYVETGPMPMGLPVPVVSAASLRELQDAAKAQLQACLKGLGAQAACFVPEGRAAATIVRAARELPAELVVVGTRGRTGLSRLTLGSVAEGVLADAPCSVLVVRLHES